MNDMFRHFVKLRRVWDYFYIRTFTDITVSDFYRKRFGVKIGNNCRIVDRQLDLFGTEPYLITLGNNVTLSGNVRFITHDGGVGVFRKEIPGLNLFGRIDIGNNTFIGMRTIILPGVSIGPNSVIGAGLVITKSIAEGSVAAGVPARVICSIGQYREKALRDGVCIINTVGKERDAEIIRHMSEPH